MNSTLPRIAVMCLVMALLSACSTRVPAPRVAKATAVEALAAWGRVLRGFVNERGEVDFAALAGERADLDSYVRFVADTRLESLRGDDDKLAHMINAYNALSMFNVIESDIPSTHAGLNKLTFFVRRKLVIGEVAMSLYTFENDVIRPFTRARGDARVHFALNCSALSCPVLPRVPFTAEGLDAELQREAKAFFARPGNFRVDAVTRTVWLNEILRFYGDDFVPAQGGNLIEVANRFVAHSVPLDYGVRFTPYDWTIANSRRPK